MSAETTFYATLSGAAGVTALVASRIYPDNVAQEVDLPAVAFSRIATEVIGTMSAPVVTTKASIECWCMATSRAQAEAVADAAIAALSLAWVVMTSRRAEYDSESETWACVMTFDAWD